MDAISLFTNIKHEDGMKEMKKKMDEEKNQETPTHFIMKLMKIILYHNKFEFNEGLYKQLIGAAMGCIPIPPYANIFMAHIDSLIKNLDGGHTSPGISGP